MLNGESLKTHKSASVYETTVSDLSENLRFLCSHKRSISEVCRALDINRQQFNKYLSGASRPSSANLRKICGYFGCDEPLLGLAHGQFVQLFEQQCQQREERIRSQKMLSLLETAFPKAEPEMDRYLGYYHAYFYSIGFPGYIGKSLLHCYREDDRIYCRGSETMAKIDEQEGPHFKFKYFGTLSMIADRLYLLEKESLLGKNLFLTIIYPCYQPKITFLNGISMGVSSTRGRDPACRNITYEYLGRHINVRQALKSCGLYQADSPKLSDEVKRRLSVKASDDPNLFFGFNHS